MAEAFPLEWPDGWARTEDRKRARFITTFDKARRELKKELARFGAESVVLSTNQPVRQDGEPYANRNLMGDPGVAVYFVRNGKQICIPCDRWDRLQDNIHAVRLAIEALRGLERWGAEQILNKAFTAFEALPPPPEEPLSREASEGRSRAVPVRPLWWQVLGLPEDAGVSEIKKRRIQMAKQYHPDSGKTPNHDMMSVMNAACDEGLEARGK